MEIVNFSIFLLIICIAITEITSCYLPATESSSSCDDLDQLLVSRDKWGAVDPSGPMECLTGPVKYVIIHHTVTNPCNSFDSCCEAMRSLQTEHGKEKDWPDIGYHFVIAGDGKAYAGRPWYKVGAHTKYHNRKSIAIAFLGDYSKESPSPEMLNIVPNIVLCGVEKGYIHPDFLVIGHRDAFCTSCPGNALYDVVKKWPRFPKNVPIPSYTCAAKSDSKPTDAPTTTTAAYETTTMQATTEANATDEESSAATLMPIYYYVILCQKAWPCPLR